MSVMRNRMRDMTITRKRLVALAVDKDKRLVNSRQVSTPAAKCRSKDRVWREEELGTGAKEALQLKAEMYCLRPRFTRVFNGGNMPRDP